MNKWVNEWDFTVEKGRKEGNKPEGDKDLPG